MVRLVRSAVALRSTAASGTSRQQLSTFCLARRSQSSLSRTTGPVRCALGSFSFTGLQPLGILTHSGFSVDGRLYGHSRVHQTPSQRSEPSRADFDFRQIERSGIRQALPLGGPICAWACSILRSDSTIMATSRLMFHPAPGSRCRHVSAH